MGLNIKNPETHRLIQELAELTGESQTAAVTEAVRERLARLKGEGSESRLDRMKRIARDCAAHIPEPWKSVDHGDLLYDEMGLPK